MTAADDLKKVYYGLEKDAALDGNVVNDVIADAQARAGEKLSQQDDKGLEKE